MKPLLVILALAITVSTALAQPHPSGEVRIVASNR